MAHDQPAYTAYTVAKREGHDDFWIPIGGAWKHQDGDGFNVVLQALPIDGKVVLRLPKSQDDQQSEDTRGQQQAIRDANNRRRSR
jgi:hypothetical protein